MPLRNKWEIHFISNPFLISKYRFCMPQFALFLYTVCVYTVYKPLENGMQYVQNHLFAQKWVGNI